MLDLGITKIALIGVVALVVIGPEKLPRMARTVGALLGKAQRYVADVKAEVGRSIELDELKKMKESMETAASDVQSSVNTAASDFEKDWAAASGEISNSISGSEHTALSSGYEPLTPLYRHPGKNWRLKRGAVPAWYKARAGVRVKAQSGAARVARFRPKPLA